METLALRSLASKSIQHRKLYSAFNPFPANFFKVSFATQSKMSSKYEHRHINAVPPMCYINFLCRLFSVFKSCLSWCLLTAAASILSFVLLSLRPSVPPSLCQPAPPSSLPPALRPFVPVSLLPISLYALPSLSPAAFSPITCAPLSTRFPQFFCIYYFFTGGLECVGHSFAYVAHLVFLRHVCLRTQRAAIARRRATNLATYLPTSILFIFLPQFCFHFLLHLVLLSYTPPFPYLYCNISPS